MLGQVAQVLTQLGPIHGRPSPVRGSAATSAVPPQYRVTNSTASAKPRRRLAVGTRKLSAWRWKQRDILVHALPLFHQHGLGGVHATLIAGSRLHLLPRFEPESLALHLEKVLEGVLVIGLALAVLEREPTRQTV